MNHKALIVEYIRCGIIQFGNIELANGHHAPIGFQLTLLPSFPKLMKATATAIAEHIPVITDRDRMLTTWDATPLGAVVSTISGMPMLWPRGELLSYTPAFSIEGTADVGNPTTLLTDLLLDGAAEKAIIERSQRTGLPIQRIFALMNLEQVTPSNLLNHTQTIVVDQLFRLSEVIVWLEESQTISETLAQAIRRWQGTL